ncbi:MAG: squalene--hopene cyclase, partial [Dehalococcoidia bacterium]|nr:squalene--hopene cyclase [Dehalococcoidia bacterium]
MTSRSKPKVFPPAGWAFEFANDTYPDTDDPAEVMLALHKVRLPDEEKKKRSLALGEKWLFGMQSGNGRWGSFDKDNTDTLISRIPFYDFGA